MRRLFIALCLLCSTFGFSGTFADFSLIKDKMCVSLSIMQKALELSQEDGFKYFQILSYNIEYKGHSHSFSTEPIDDYGVELTATNNNNHLTIYGYFVPIDDKAVIDNDGSHGARRKDGSIALEEGYHKFRLVYFESYMGSELEVGISGLNIRESRIPDDMLYLKK